MGKHIRITLTPEERAEIAARIRKTPQRALADRLRVILYKADGCSHQQIADLLQIQSINTITTWLQVYVERGIEALCAWNYPGTEPRLEARQQTALQWELHTTIYHTAAQVIAWVKEQFAVEYTPRGMQALLKRLGFTYKKNRLVPSKADPEAQAQWVTDYRKLVAELGPEDRLYFGDGAYLLHNAAAGYSWSERGNPHQIPSNSGRDRYNLLGVYCVQTEEFLFIQTRENVNKHTVIELLKALRQRHPEPARIYLILDNARSHRARDVTDYCEQTGLTRFFLPTYSPNLNVIERFWKYLRKTLFHDHYYPTFDRFVAAIQHFLEHLEEHRTALTTLLTDNFETLPSGWKVETAAANSQN